MDMKKRAGLFSLELKSWSTSGKGLAELDSLLAHRHCSATANLPSNEKVSKFEQFDI
jgi:hypothetical protein